MASGFILTDIGVEEIEKAYQAGKTVTIKQVAVGDGGGAVVPADPTRTTLVGPFGNAPLTLGAQGEGLIRGQTVINCRDYPGKVVRELGLMSDTGVLVAYGSYPETYLPEQSDSILKELVINFVIMLENASAVTLVVDPSAALTQDAADDRYLNEDANLSDVDDVAEARKNLSVYSQEESNKTFVPQTRKINGHALNQDVTLTAGDVGAYTQEESNKTFVPQTRKINGHALNQDVTLTAGDVDAYTKAESDSRFIQGVRLGGELGLTGSEHYVDEGQNRIIRATPGCLVSGMLDASISPGTFNNIDVLLTQPVMVNIKGIWMTISQVNA